MAENTVTTLTKTYTSYSGADIVATFKGKVIAELQGITYAVSREKAPVYTMGSAEPRSFSRGKRGISGSLVFTVFDRDALVDALKDDHVTKITNVTYAESTGQYDTTAISIDEWDAQMNNNLGETSASTLEGMNKLSASVEPRYSDEVPPFDITVSFMNEYGNKAVLEIFGVEILNEGSGFSIDNVISEKACTFVARSIKPMRKVSNTDNMIAV